MRRNGGVPSILHPKAPFALAAAACILVGMAREPARAQEYRLSPGDVVGVIVQGEPTLSSAAAGLTIGPDGRFAFPYAGSVLAEGKTCAEVADSIRRALIDQQIVTDPQITVFVVRFVVGAPVLGYVAKPGMVPIQHDRTRVSEVIAAVGGVIPDQGDDTRVTVTRADGTVIEVDLEAVLAGRAPDVMLVDGDTVYVPRTQWEVTVAGYARNPGVYPLHDGDRVSTVLAKAGGIAVGTGAGNPIGDPTNINVIRADGSTATLSLEAALSGAGDGAQDPPVGPGDTVYVSESRQFYSVLGMVARPGQQRLRPGDRLSDALAQVGGPITTSEVSPKTVGADLTNCVLYRAGGDPLQLDLSPLYDPQAAFDDVALKPGDVLVVPEAKNQVVVLGYVDAPGYFGFRPGETAREAIARAGDVIKGEGSLARVELKRADGATSTLDLTRDDVELRAGDQLTVPYVSQRIAVLGRVAQPGVYEWHEGDRLADMLAQASGPDAPRKAGSFRTEAGHPYRALLLRVVDGQEKTIPVDLRPFLRKGDRDANPEVFPGDVIYVPVKGSFDIEGVVQSLLLIPRSFR